MNFLRIILLILLFLMGRRVYRNFRDLGRSAKRPSGTGTRQGPEPGNGGPDMQDLTDQDISDADFEEIP